MNEEKTFAQKVIQFDENLSNISIELPEGFKIINPFNGDKKETYIDCYTKEKNICVKE